MPIDEGLNQLPETKVKDIKTTQTKTVSNTEEINSILKSYIQDISNYEHKKYIDKILDTPIITQFVEYLRFKEDFTPTFVDIPREKFFEVVYVKNEKIKYLLENTNIREIVPEKISLDDIKNNKTMYNLKETHEVLKELYDFEEKGNNLFMIPDPGFLSLFIEDGEKFRDYLKSATILKSTSHKILTIDPRDYSTDYTTTSDLDIQHNLFNLDLLVEFCSKENVSEISNMINQVNNLKEDLKFVGSYKKISTYRNNLLKKLEIYNPKLIYRGVSK
jgi:hypothetical protein